jgi:hypothetical protein
MNATKLVLALVMSVVLMVAASPSEAATTAGEVKIELTGKQFLVQMQSDQTVKKCTYDSGTAKFSCVDIVSAGPNFLYQGAVDLNGDNISDAVFLNISQAIPATPAAPQSDKGDIVFWPNFNKSQAITPRQARTLWRAESVGDLDGDGCGDVSWRFTGQTGQLDDTGVVYIWFMNCDGTISQVRKRGGAPFSWKILGSADLNGSGAAGTIWINTSDNQIRVHMPTANRTCANFGAGFLDTRFVASHVASFTFSNVPDVLARHPATGVVRLTTLNASGIPLPVYTGAPDDPNASCTRGTVDIPQVLRRDLDSDPTWQIYATGDFNNDGVIDIVWIKPDGTLALWTMPPGGGLPIVNNNAGTAPLGYVGLSEQSGVRTNTAESVTYAIWGLGGSPYLVTKDGVTPVINQTPFTVGVYPLYNCWLAHAALPDGKILASCQDALNAIRRTLYIDRQVNAIREYAGVVPTDIKWLASTPFDPLTPNWSAKARVKDGWYFTSNTETWVLLFRNDSGQVSTIKREITPTSNGNLKVLGSYTIQ